VATDKRTILIQLDGDPQPSVFDRVVALDAGAEVVLSYGGVRVADVRDKVHGAIFTRDVPELHRTALFIGGSDVVHGERLLAEALRHMIPQFGLRVSVLLDANGANTTAAAAVRVAARHLALAGVSALVLGAGPVGRRVALLLTREGADVCVSDREQALAAAAGDAVRARAGDARVRAAVTATPEQRTAALVGRSLVIAAGPTGVSVLPREARRACPTLRVVIDLNAVPPAGVEGVEATDKAVERDGAVCYGALPVGRTKMKLHKAAVARLFESNDQVLDAEQVYALGGNL
jgi:hypothetical protein